MKKRTITTAIATIIAAASITTIPAGAGIKSVSMSDIMWTGSNVVKTAADAVLGSYEVTYAGALRLDVLMVSDVENIGGYDWVMTLIDQTGHEWQVVDEDLCDMFVGDLVAVMFDDVQTLGIYDDRIVEWSYSGWVSDEEAANWVK